jgi:hypothetical protein
MKLIKERVEIEEKRREEENKVTSQYESGNESSGNNEDGLNLPHVFSKEGLMMSLRGTVEE